MAGFANIAGLNVINGLRMTITAHTGQLLVINLNCRNPTQGTMASSTQGTGADVIHGFLMTIRADTQYVEMIHRAGWQRCPRHRRR